MWRLKQHRSLWLALQGTCAALALYFFARALAGRWASIAAFHWSFRPGLLAVSLLLQAVAGLLWASVWNHMMARSGSPLKWKDGVRIYFVSNLAKYIPGSVWGYVGRAYLGWDKGATAGGVGVSAVWEVGTTVIASLLLTAVTLRAFVGQIPPAFLALTLVAGLVGLANLIPPVFGRWLQLFERWRVLGSAAGYRWRDLGLYLLAALATHILVGAGCFLFARSFLDIAPQYWWGFTGAWSFAATAGLLFFLAPYGLGVKEGLLVLLLQAFLPLESALLISVASRLWTIFGELLNALLAGLILR